MGKKETRKGLFVIQFFPQIKKTNTYVKLITLRLFKSNIENARNVMRF